MDFIKKLLNIVFVCGVVSFMTLGTIIVAVQCFGIITTNGALTTGIAKTLGKPAYIIAAVTGLVGFVQGYVNGWAIGD